MEAVRRGIAIFGLAAMIAACGGSISDVTDTTTQDAAGAASTSEATENPAGAGTAIGGSDTGDLVWSAVEFGCDFVDDVEARGRVTNNGDDISSASFTITVLQGGSIAATLSGLVSDLGSGQTRTVEFISLDDCLEGDFEYEIQTDFSLGGSGGGSSMGGGEGDFTWESVDFGCDFVDDVEARGRVTNNGADISSAAFTITVLQGGSIMATLTGFVGDLSNGQTKTVEFISTDPCFDGEFTYEIQTDFAM